MFVSPPEASIDGLFPVAAFTKVISLTAELVAVILATSLLFVSKMEVPIIGDVNVLFVKVCVPAVVTLPAGKVRMSGLVPSFAVAKTTAVYEGATVTEFPEPETYLNTTF